MRKALLGALALLVSASTQAAIPLLNYSCPTGLSVHADQGGPVFINGKEARLKKFNDNYYEASDAGVTVSISRNPDASMSVSYTRKGGAHGICTAQAAGGSASSAAAATAPSASSAAASDGNLNLHCRGSGYANKSETKTVKDANSSTGYTTTRDTERKAFNASLDVRIAAGMAQIRVPKDLIPRLNSADRDGWVALQDVRMTDREITGKAGLNNVNRPTVRIDRGNGDIEIKGASGTFNGECQKAGAEERKF